MSRILVTGGSGFIGANVARALSARGDQVAVFDITRPARLDGIANLTFVQGEITEWPQLMATVQAHRPDAIVHCAAVVGVTNSLASPIGTFRVNVDGSLNVFEAMRLFGVKRAINLSSEETYGVFERDTIDETHPNRPIAPYGISKVAAERLACDYVARYGLEIVHIRTCWVYGPGLPRPRAPKIFVDAAVRGERLHLPGGGDFRVDHVYIDDCVAGIIKTLGCSRSIAASAWLGSVSTRQSYRCPLNIRRQFSSASGSSSTMRILSGAAMLSCLQVLPEPLVGRRKEDSYREGGVKLSLIGWSKFGAGVDWESKRGERICCFLQKR